MVQRKVIEAMISDAATMASLVVLLDFDVMTRDRMPMLSVYDADKIFR